MYSLVTPAHARHRREPSVRQRIRGSIGLLVVLALIAAFGIFGSGLTGGQAWQASVIESAPVPPRVFGWATYAVPLAGVFGLVAPTRVGVLRVAVSILLLVPSVALMTAMSRPRGIAASQWAVDPAFARAQEVTSYTLMAALLLWAFVAVIVICVRRTEDAALKVRRTILWAGPLTIFASLAVALTTA